MPRVFATHCRSPGAGRVVPQPRQATVTTSAMAARMTRIYSTAPAESLVATRHEARCQPSSPSDHGDGSGALEDQLVRLVARPDPDLVAVGIDRDRRHACAREHQCPRRRVASIHHLVRAVRPGREANEVATLQRVLTIGRTQDERPVNDEKPLLLVLVVVRARAAAGIQVVDEHHQAGRAQRWATSSLPSGLPTPKMLTDCMETSTSRERDPNSDRRESLGLIGAQRAASAPGAAMGKGGSPPAGRYRDTCHGPACSASPRVPRPRSCGGVRRSRPGRPAFLQSRNSPKPSRN